MLPISEIKAWRKKGDWPEDDQVEQDLIISAALVQIFNHPYLQGKLAFRGGTALNKLIFPSPLRYSEDIDLNRLENSPAGPIFDAVRDSLRPLFNNIKAKSISTKNSVKLVYSYPSIVGGTRNLKIEINVKETLPQEKLVFHDFEVDSNFFAGSAKLVAFDTEEMIATKIRALYQRKKGRDLFDLYELSKLPFDWNKIINSFKKLDIGANQKKFLENLEDKMEEPAFLNDIIPLLPNNVNYDPQIAYEWFKDKIIPKLDL